MACHKCKNIGFNHIKIYIIRNFQILRFVPACIVCRHKQVIFFISFRKHLQKFICPCCVALWRDYVTTITFYRSPLKTGLKFTWLPSKHQEQQLVPYRVLILRYFCHFILKRADLPLKGSGCHFYGFTKFYKSGITH